MQISTMHVIKSNPLLKSYLKVNSSWYKMLNRDGNSIKEMEKEARRYFKLTFPDKIERFSNQMNMISMFMDVLK